MEFAAEFVVGVRVDLVWRTRRRRVRGEVLLDTVGIALGSFAVAFGVWLITLGEVLPGLLVGLAGAGSACLAITLLRRARALWARRRAEGVSPVAMRFTHQGLWCHLDTARDGFLLPWHTIAGVHKHGETRGLVFIDVARGVNPITPGVLGLEHPEVRRTLSGRPLGHSGLRYTIEHLDQPLAVIDEALAHYSEGLHQISRAEH